MHLTLLCGSSLLHILFTVGVSEIEETLNHVISNWKMLRLELRIPDFKSCALSKCLH